MIAIVDYGMANLRSVEKAIKSVGGDPLITSNVDEIAAADKVILPGVGAFCAAMQRECREWDLVIFTGHFFRHTQRAGAAATSGKLKPTRT